DIIGDLMLEDCKLKRADGQDDINLERRPDGSWVSFLDHDTLLSVRLAIARRQKGRLVLDDAWSSRSKGLSQRIPKKSPDVSTVVLIELFNQEPGKLSERIEETKQRIAEEKTNLGKSDKEEQRNAIKEKIGNMEAKKKRFEKLLEIYKSRLTVA